MTKGKQERVSTPDRRAVQKPAAVSEMTPIRRFWQRYRWGLSAALALYLWLAIFFGPIVFEGKELSPAADMIAAAGMYRIGEGAVADGHFPLWNPTLFCGLPMFASLQYALFVYPPEYIIRLFSHIFGGGDYRIWLFHYLLAGIFTYLLARHLGAGRIAAWLSGAAYAFSPQLIVLTDVGHGSKLMAMTWLPLIWLLIDRLRLKPNISRMAALGLIFAIQVLALHPQVAAYGALLMGVYLLYNLVGAVKRKAIREWLRFGLHWGGALALALGLSAVLWVSVLDYARYSMRGAASGAAAPTGGGVSWEYATGWSFHPLESITYIFPSFFGFGNETYWGTVGTPDGTPFTHNPMYFGVVVLLLAIVALAFTPKHRWGFALTIGLTAWILSFGKYLPILYGTFFNILPLFNKFRAPVMGQVLLLLPMAVLAGLGLQALIERLTPASSTTQKTKTAKKPPSQTLLVLYILIGIGLFKILLILAGEGFFFSIYQTLADIIRPGADRRLLQAAAKLARPDTARALGLVVVMLAAIVMVIKRKIAVPALTGVFLILFVIDLWPIDRKLVTFTPPGSKETLFQPDGVVKHLQKQTGKFRLHPLDTRYKAANWWSYFGIETTNGYFGAKMADYQAFMDAFAVDIAPPQNWVTVYKNPQLLDALNVRYIITSYPLDMVFEELQRQGLGSSARPASAYTLEVMGRELRPGTGPFLYRNPGELPRARLVGNYEVLSDRAATFRAMQNSGWQPQRSVFLDRPPTPEPASTGEGKAEIVEYANEHIVIKTSSPTPKILVLSDTYYPSGWSAFIDGKPVEILRADWVMRAVALPAGEWTVEFVFKPKLFYAGLWASLVSLLLIVGVAVFAVLRRKARDN